MKRVSIVETNLQFREPLSVRQVTDRFDIHWIGPIPAGLDPDRIDADRVNSWHIDRGFAGIAYHYLIKQDGNIERGRPRQCRGAHDEGENFRSIGICLVSGPGLPVTDAQISSLCGLLADLCDIYGQLPDAPGVIVGHRDYEPAETPTECPGDAIYGLLPAIRERVKAALGY